MADADEDAIPRHPPTSSTTTDPSADLEDEAQDFRFLAALSKNTAGTLPRRGEKDFEPNPTQAQSNTLAASREAMHNALSVERVLLPRNDVVGQYLPDPKDWRWDARPGNHGSGKGGRCVVVEKFRTTYAKSCGVADFRNWTWLLPEEALFLLERGTLDVRWPDEEVRRFMKEGGKREKEDDSDDSDVGQSNQEENNESGDEAEVDLETDDPDSATKLKHPQHTPLTVGEMPMSLQGAYASLIGKSGLTLERYNVYAGLRRLGYIVQRAPTWDEGNDDIFSDQEMYTNGHAPEPNGHATQPLLPMPSQLESKSVTPTPQNTAASLINRLVSYLNNPTTPYRPSTGPLIYPGLYRNYNSIFRTLTLIPAHSTTSYPSSTTPKPPYTISYYAFKPSPNTQFRKSAPPPPDFRIAVLDARTTSVPSVSELGCLLDTMPTDQLPREKRMEQRLKHGVRNVVLAIVDCGVVSYLRVADMCSASEGKVFETKASRGSKRGGGFRRGGGRGGKR